LRFNERKIEDYEVDPTMELRLIFRGPKKKKVDARDANYT